VTTTNWQALETEYVTGDVTYAGLAVKHAVSLRQVANHAKAEGWVAKREQWRNETASKAQQKSSDVAAEVHGLLYEIWRELLRRYLQALQKAGIEVDADDVRGWTKLLMADLSKKPPLPLQGLDLAGMSDAELDEILSHEG